tara:strand:- start:704 stop:1078 length:375 start_codon:yes stop_codon:yes gene_type:complete
MKSPSLKLFLMYLLVLLCLFITGYSNGQTLKLGDDLTIVHFNAGWNSANNVKWVSSLNDVKIKRCDIATDTKSASKHEIIVVPTIIIFNHGKEIKRYQADISFSMKATKYQIQSKIDDILMESF